jgi:hypothetical protein
VQFLRQDLILSLTDGKKNMVLLVPYQIFPSCRHQAPPWYVDYLKDVKAFIHAESEQVRINLSSRYLSCKGNLVRLRLLSEVKTALRSINNKDNNGGTALGKVIRS